jgi:tetrahydromethanopterin S-methyltransferase subunit G
MSVEDRVNKLENQVQKLDHNIDELSIKLEYNTKQLDLFIDDIKYVKSRIDNMDKKIDTTFNSLQSNISKQTYLIYVPYITLGTAILGLTIKLLDPFQPIIVAGVVSSIAGGIAGATAWLWHHFRNK